jgi:hypothetical protein
MPDFLTQPSAFLIFLGIAAFGFLFLVVSLVFVEVFDFFDHDGSMDGHFDGAPTFLSTRVLSVLVTAFGAFGAIGMHLEFSIPASSAMGVAGGFTCAGIVYWFAVFLFNQQATSVTASADLAGRTARVIVSIPESGVGQVRVQMGDEIMDKIARSRDGAAIAENMLVTVDDVIGEIVIVRPHREG